MTFWRGPGQTGTGRTRQSAKRAWMYFPYSLWFVPEKVTLVQQDLDAWDFNFPRDETSVVDTHSFQVKLWYNTMQRKARDTATSGHCLSETYYYDEVKCVFLMPLIPKFKEVGVCYHTHATWQFVIVFNIL